jgi:serine/threonine protein phosphatase PrpC
MSSLRQWMESYRAGPPGGERSIVVLPTMRRDSKQRWEAVASTDTGLVRQGNEDSYDMRLERGMFVVCDGMGGAAAGEVASKLAVESFLASLDETQAEAAVDDAAIRRAVQSADERVRDTAQNDPSLRGMGTTLVALVLPERDSHLGFVVHAGDSRCYRFRENHLEQMTADHSFVEEQVRQGQLTEAEARRSPLRNVITRAIGSQEPTDPEVAQVDLSRGDVYLLCSDGLTREVTDEGIREVLEEEKNLSVACTELVQEAVANGGRDNITCILVRIL